MTVSTLRPNSTTYDTGTVVGAASAHAALSDDSDSSYYAVADVLEMWVGGFTDLTLPAGALIKHVAVRIRCRGGPPMPAQMHAALAFAAPWPVQYDEDIMVSWVSSTTITATGLTVNTAGISDGNIDGASAAVRALSTTPVVVNEVYLDVTYVAVPVVSADAPTGTVGGTNQPTVEWSTTLDSDGGSLTHYEVKVFTDAEYGAGGFDPDTSTPTQTSGIVNYPGAVGWLPDPLADDTYRAYVRIAQTVNASQHWSDWDFAQFDVSVDLPGTPLFNAAPDDAAGKVALQIIEQLGDATTDFYEIQRSIDGGTTWENVRTLDGGIASLPYVAATGTFSDTADGTSHALTLPNPGGGIQAGDMLVAIVAMDSNPTLSWPTGWTEIKDVAGDGNQVRAGVAFKRAVGGESGTITLTTSASEGGAARILCIRGAHSTATPAVSNGINASSANGGNPDALNPGWTDANTLFIAAVANDGNVAVTAGPSGYNSFGNTRWANASGAGISTAYVRADAGSVVDPGAFTHAAEEVHAFTVAVRSDNALDSLADYEAPNGVDVDYRARAVHDYSGEYAVSAWATDDATLSSTSWWLKHPHRPDLNTTVEIRSFQAVQRAGRAGVFQPLGSSIAVVVADQARGAMTGQVVLKSFTQAAQDDLDTLLDTQATLLLQSPAGAGGPDYIRFLDHARERVVDWQDASRVWDALGFVQVASPTGDVVSWP